MGAMQPRPATYDDLDRAVEIVLTGLPIPPEFDDGTRRDWIRERTRSLIETDPGGQWLLEDEDGEAVGMASALVRDGIWGLSGMTVLPDRQAKGAGTKLMRAALTHAEGTRGGLICSSVDPKAMRLYARAGFDLRPCVAAAGIVDRTKIPASLESRESDDAEQAAELSVPVRGGAYGAEDLAALAARPGFGMRLLDGRGFAIHYGNGSPSVLCAHDEEAAQDLLWSCFAHGQPGASVHVDFITAGQDWAVQTVLRAGLPLSPEGPLYTRGDLGPLRPWLPSGSLL